jgi:hypothetical protein
VKYAEQTQDLTVTVKHAEHIHCLGSSAKRPAPFDDEGSFDA